MRGKSVSLRISTATAKTQCKSTRRETALQRGKFATDDNDTLPGAFPYVAKKKKRLLPSSRLSVRPSLSASIGVTPTERIFVKFDTEEFYENLSLNTKFS